MCGIAGYAGWDGRSELPAMVGALEHRGPDDCGSKIFANAGLGFRRLSIIDLDGGHQPLTSEDGRVHAVVNGEIYNHEQLRSDLSSLGHIFKSRSDCESVVHAYEQWGPAAFDRLEGMFAAAIWDERDGKLTLGRDRLGKKPLYWCSVNGGIAFASEPKSLLFGNKPRTVSPVATLLYLVSDSVPTPHSIWTGVHKLPAAGVLQWSDVAGPSLTTFWPRHLASVETLDSTAWTASFEEALRSAVRDRLMADVPLGVFLSAGVDSMLVAAVARQQTRKPMHSYTLRFEDATYDESEQARDFARAHGLTHHEVRASSGEMVAALDRLVDVFDEPVNDPACIVMLPLAEAASHTIKVALTGDGGDELFLGYRHMRVHEALTRLPSSVQRALGSLRHPLAAVPDKGGYFSAGFKAQRLARGLGRVDLLERDLAWRGAFGIDHARSLLSHEFGGHLGARDVLPHFQDLLDASPVAGNGLQELTWLYLRSYLLDTVLVKVDRSTMAYGVEARSPLLDRRVVELVMQMPIDLRTGTFRNKRLMRTVLAGVAPLALPATTKHGMGVPVRELLSGPLRARLHDLASPAHLRTQGIFDPDAVGRMIASFEAGKRDLRKEVWGFLMYQLWFERWADSQFHAPNGNNAP
jgi:asparagine synthase (glutamine-hydrolysing)